MQRQTRRGSRGRYMSAGAIYDERENLYISRETAGSARDSLRDNAYANREKESPEPVLGEPVRTVRTPAKPMGPLDILIREIRRDKVSAVLCLVLFCLFIGLGTVYLKKMSFIRSNLAAIADDRANTAKIQTEILHLEEELRYAKSGETIRNQAQNTLGMLRRERAEVRELYIQIPEEIQSTKVSETEEETKFGLLDALLNLVGILRL